MVKKYVSLLMVAVLFATALDASQPSFYASNSTMPAFSLDRSDSTSSGLNGYSDMKKSDYADESTSRILKSWYEKQNNTNKVNLNSGQSIDKNSSATAQASNILNDAFQRMEAWTFSPSLSASYRPGKEFILKTEINKAFKALDKATGGDTSPVKDAMLRAVRAFSTSTTASDINSDVLRGIINSVKTVMLAPLKTAIIAASTGVGAAAVTVGNTAVTIGAGISKTGRKLSEIPVYKNDIALKSWRTNAAFGSFGIKGKIISPFIGINWGSVALLVPKAIVITLIGVVDTALLAAYAVPEGLALGTYGGLYAAHKAVGNPIALDKPTEEENLREADKGSLEAQAAQEQATAAHVRAQQATQAQKEQARQQEATRKQLYGIK